MKTASPQKPASVLIIDDEPQIQRLLTIALEAEGYAVNSASTGQAGMALAAQQSRDLIILDLGLPELASIPGTPVVRARNISRGHHRTLGSSTADISRSGYRR